jgi:FtsH-binding integral membrane protein
MHKFEMFVVAIAFEMFSLTIYVFITKKEISIGRGLVFVILFTIIPMSLICIYYYEKANNIWGLVICILITSTYIILNTKLFINDDSINRVKYDSKAYIIAVILIYLDIILFFLFILKKCCCEEKDD